MAWREGVNNFAYQHDDDSSDYSSASFHHSEESDNLKISGELTANSNWNRFEKKKTKIISYSSVSKFRTTRDIICKLFTIFLFFSATLFLLVTSKLSIIALTSHLRTVPDSQQSEDSGDATIVDVRWIWAVFTCSLAPEVLTFILSVLKICIKKKERYGCLPTFVCMVTECLHSVGLLLFLFLVLPNLQPILGCLLQSVVGLVPSILRVFVEWDTQCKRILCNIISISTAVTYLAVLATWCYISYQPSSTVVTVCLPISVVLISSKWWDSYAGLSNGLSVETTKHVAVKDMFVALVKIITTFLGTILIYGYAEDDKCVRTLFFMENESDKCSGLGVLQLTTDYSLTQLCQSNFPFVLAGLTIGGGLVCYMLSVAACKAHIQVQCFSVPILLSTPVSFGVLLLIYRYGSSVFSECIFNDAMMAPGVQTVVSSIGTPVWVCSILSWILFCLVTSHIWVTSEGIMTKREKLFCKPMFCNIFLGESLALSRRRSREAVDKSRDSHPPDHVVHSIEPNVIVCATMWHETEVEMSQVLKSIFRLDTDRYARGVVGENSYNLQANIFLDDAFEEVKDVHTRQINCWTKQLIRVVKDTYLCLREKNTKLGKPLKPVCCDTPFGGKIVWKLPGGTILAAYLKDKTKIRNKKRWSQVMYMYYFLGFRMSNNTQEDERNNASRFLLALDGDVDFQEEALRKLIDRMLTDPDVGAACGRIHPVGNGMGPILWYQKFEYAVSHWLQKATEHVTGCVLCSPGCFSLYRASALMDKDVIRKYATPSTQSQHFVQYDQGEDRWLCTLLLQRGHRIEYCAASDSYTYAPEGFGEFFNQRKRWNPSTMSNTMDLLMNWRHLTKKNNTISSLFLLYETALLLCLLFTPGTIFLLILGAINLAFPAVPLYGALILNVVPVGTFVVICLNAETKTQIKVAGVLCIMYILAMMVVMVGLILQAVEHGVCSATSLFLVAVIGIFFTTALLHPQEFLCIFAGIIYFFFTPTMSMLLVIYSVCNLNNISWGTRENKMAADPHSRGHVTQGGQPRHLWSRLTNSEGFVRSVCRCLCLTTTDENSKIIEKLDNIEKMMEQSRNEDQAPALQSTDGCYLHWTEENYFGTRIELEEKEEAFWKDLIQTYLIPEQETDLRQEDIKADLKELRNKVCLLFLVCNSLLVILVVTLQMNTDLNIHLPCASTRFVRESFEPISVTFMVVFGFVLVIQFLAMLIHRLGTFLHIVATTDIQQKKEILPTNSDTVEDEPDGIRAKKEINGYTELDGESKVRLLKFLLLHDLNQVQSDSEDGNSSSGSSEDEEIPRYESIRMNLSTTDIEDRQRKPIISGIAKKLKITDACVKRFLKAVNGRKEITKEENELTAVKETVPSEFQITRRQLHSSGDRVTSRQTAASPAAQDEMDGRRSDTMYMRRVVKVRTQDTGMRNGAHNHRIRPILKNRISPRAATGTPEPRAFAVVHTTSRNTEINIDDLTNETKL